MVACLLKQLKTMHIAPRTQNTKKKHYAYSKKWWPLRKNHIHAHSINNIKKPARIASISIKKRKTMQIATKTQKQKPRTEPNISPL